MTTDFFTLRILGRTHLVTSDGLFAYFATGTSV